MIFRIFTKRQIGITTTLIVLFSIFYVLTTSNVSAAISSTDPPKIINYNNQTYTFEALSNKGNGHFIYKNGNKYYDVDPTVFPGPSINPGIGEAFGYRPPNTASLTGQPTSAPSNSKCDGGITGLSFCGLIIGIGEALLHVAGFFMWLGAILFDFIMNFTVVNFKGNIGNINAINVGWSVFRDLANIFFIFILLYIAIGTILRLEGVNTKKMLSTLIVMALLLNFSLFFTKVIIDGSNIFSLVFYSKITVNGQPLNNTDPYSNNTLANAFAAPLGLGPLFAAPNTDTASQQFKSQPGIDINKDYIGVFLQMLFGSVLLMILAFVFFAASLLFIVRFVVLIFLMLLSPLAFAGMILPKTKSMIADKWWKSLIDQSIFAPVFFMLLWVVLAIISDPNFKSHSADLSISWTTLFSGTEGATKAAFIVFNYMLIIALLMGTIITSKLLGGQGAVGAVNLANKVANGARKGAQGYLGRGAVRATGINRLENFAKDTKFGESAPMRALRGITTGALTKSKFGSKDSVSSVDKADKKRAEDIAKKTDEGVTSKFRDSLPERRATKLESIKSELPGHEATLTSSQQVLDKAKTDLATINNKNDFSPAGQAERAAAQQAVTLAQTKVDTDKGVVDRVRKEQAEVTAALDEQKRTGVVKDFSESEKKELNAEREKAIQIARGLAPGPIEKKIGFSNPISTVMKTAVAKKAKRVFYGVSTSDVDKAIAKRLEQRLAGKNIELEETLKEMATKEGKAESSAPKPPSPPKTT